MSTHNGGPMRKDFAVFDCDAHINDPRQIWSDYLEPEYRDAVKRAYWQEDNQTILNGRTVVIGGQAHDFATYNPICIAGPGMNKKIMRKLQQMGLSPEQRKYLEHQGAYDPHARLRDMDLMGIDQVMIIPTMMVAHYPYVEDVYAAHGFARAYNNWVSDFCKQVPHRLFPAGWLPLQDPEYTRQELHRIAKMGLRVALIRPIDARGRYPNQIFPSPRNGTLTNTMDKVFRAFEETGIVCGMHTFPALPSEPSDLAVSVGELIGAAGSLELGGKMVDVQTLSFVFEAMTWLAQILLSGFLEMYPRLKMAIFESNATWLPEMLEHCDRLFKLYANERLIKADRLPSEAFAAQCYIAFESDEDPVFQQWDRFEDVGIWSSDAYHHDGADSWSAMRRMEKAGVPKAVQEKMLGANARRMYGIEPHLFVTEEGAEVPRPDWFPKAEDVERWAAVEADPRANGVTQSIDFSKMDPRMIMSAIRVY
jgi:predicted TIM-barrel fold metal-dependent hydrolase